MCLILKIKARGLLIKPSLYMCLLAYSTESKNQGFYAPVEKQMA